MHLTSTTQKNSKYSDVRSRNLQKSLKQDTPGISTTSSKTSSIPYNSKLRDDDSESLTDFAEDAERFRDEETLTLSDSNSQDDSANLLSKPREDAKGGCRCSNSESHETGLDWSKKVAKKSAGARHRALLIENELSEIGQGFMSHCSKTLYYIGVFF